MHFHKWYYIRSKYIIIPLGLFLILCLIKISDDDVDGRDVLWAGTSGGAEDRSSDTKTLFG